MDGNRFALVKRVWHPVDIRTRALWFFDAFHFSPPDIYWVICHRGGDEAVEQMWVKPSTSCCMWWRWIFLKRHQSYCLITVTIEYRCFLEVIGHVTIEKILCNQCSNENSQGILSYHIAEGFQKTPRTHPSHSFGLWPLVISSFIYTLLICFLLPILIFHPHSLFNFSTDSKNKEKGQDSTECV